MPTSIQSRRQATASDETLYNMQAVMHQAFGLCYVKTLLIERARKFYDIACDIALVIEGGNFMRF